MTIYNLKCRNCGKDFQIKGKPHQSSCSISCGGRSKPRIITDKDIYHAGWNPTNAYIARTNLVRW